MLASPPEIMLTSNRLRAWLSPLVAALPLLLTAPGASAAKPSLSVEPFAGKKLRLDGGLFEWPGGFENLTETVKGRAVDASALLAYDDEALYLGFKTKSGGIARRAAPGPGQDQVSLEIYFPAVPGFPAKTHRIDIYPGDPGKLPALVVVDGAKVSSAQAVEAPTEGGFDLEAKIPWSALSAARHVRVGLRGRIVFANADKPGSTVGIGSTSQKTGKNMPALTLEAETGLVQYLEEHQVPFTPDREAFGDMNGDGQTEHVALYHHYLTIVGAGYRGGKEFYLSELDISDPKAIRRLELADLGKNGKADLLIVKRVGSERDKYREMLQVLSLGDEGAPREIFLAEVSIVTPEGRIENEVRAEQGKLIVRQGKSEGFDPNTYHEPVMTGVEAPALMPWDTTESRVYGLEGDRLKLIQEKTWTPKMKAKPQGSGFSSKVSGKPERRVQRKPTLTQVHESYMAEKGVAAKVITKLSVDVAEDGRAEEVLLQGKDIVVFGEGFKHGETYSYVTLPVKDEKDIVSLTTANLTGDGKAALIVNALLRAPTTGGKESKMPVRQALLVYKLVGGRLVRIFSAETGRLLGEKRVLGSVRFLPSQSGGSDIELLPGRAVGWTERSYPYPADTDATAGLEPLLLPWGADRARRYTFRNGKFELSSS